MKFPNLFIPGAAKSGTSTLHEMLNQHPEICMSYEKEPFFMIQNDFEKNMKFYEARYNELFKHKPDATYFGDSSTSYMLFPNFIKRTKKYLKNDVKFIFILRNPVDRILSSFLYIKSFGSERLKFEDAILKDMHIEPNLNTKLPEGKFKSYFQYGLYGKWLKRFYDSFDDEQVKIILFEDFKINPLSEVNDCFRFLNLSEMDSLITKKTNATRVLKHAYLHENFLRLTGGRSKIMKPVYNIFPRKTKDFFKVKISDFIIKITETKNSYPKLTDEQRKWLANLYKDDFVLLKQLVDKDFSLWKDFNIYE